MRTIRQIISAHAPAIVDAWAEQAQQAAAARGLTRPELLNILPTYLQSLTPPAGEDTRRSQIALIENHLSSRLRAGFNLEEVVDELAILRRAIVCVCSRAAPEDRPDVADVDHLFSDLDAASVAVTKAFRQYLDEDEQDEKRFLRLLAEPFSNPDDDGPPLSPERLTPALAVVMEAMRADTAALLLHEISSGDLVMTASVGLAEEPFAQYVRSVDESSFVGSTASRTEPTSLRDVETTALDVPDALRHSGIHSVLGVRLPAQRILIGVLYIGLRETRSFTSREERRLEAVGAELSLQLDNARLYAELLKQIDSLHVEQRLRQQFVAVLAHDLRGPLSAARLAAELLSAQPDAPNRAERVSVLIRNLDRTDRLVTNLLDAERIQAGKPLPLTLAEADLGEIARQAVSDFEASNPGRFVLQLEENVRGIWGPTELQRAIWNLLANALKYGEKGAPITVTVTRRPDGADVSVHNEGAPISEEAQRMVFEPFARVADLGAAPGWGLGLTLVRACAEAHGGSVSIDSQLGRGTTFTMRLPCDARPAQRKP